MSEDGLGTIQELREWLFDRVADDNDIVVDEMQEEFGLLLEQNDDDLGLPGSDEYQTNVQLQRRLSKSDEGLSKSGQNVHDGIRPCRYYGQSVEDGRPHGQGMLRYDNRETFSGTFDHGVLNRRGELRTADSLCISGSWKDGFMDGEMRIETGLGAGGGWIEGYWKLGVPHGYQREFGAKDLSGHRRMIKAVGRYHRGIRRGFWWKGLMGGGFLCGYVDQNGDFSGPDWAFIYPDFSTALRGEFHQGLLVEARTCHVVGFKLAFGIAIPEFTTPSGPAFTFEQPTRKAIANNPLLRDPWEDKIVYVEESLLPQGGMGLFAKRDIRAKELICFYNGIRLRTSSYAAQHADHSDYRIRLNADVDLDIPDDKIHVSQYNATLGHKINHSNVPNADWTYVEHPRFGLIRGIVSIREIKRDDEVLINYHMNLGDAPMWYRQVWLQHQRRYKKKSDDSIIRFLNKYYEDTGKRVDIDLGQDDDEFQVPPPKGIGNLDDLPDDDLDEDEGNSDEIDTAKRLLKIKCVDDDEEPKITEIIEI